MTTVREALKAASRDLTAAGVDTARLDARLLLGHALGREVWPHEESPIDAASADKFQALVARRERREPVSRIIGRRGFWTLDLAVGPGTLDPRPDSETLIEALAPAFAGRAAPRRVLDLGTGTGCLLLAALVEFPIASGLGIDRSGDAIAVARDNAVSTGLAARVRLEEMDWSDLSDVETFDLVLSNPPYITEAEIPALAPEVREHDPLTALAAGPDGLDAYRALAGVIPRVLSRNGVAVLELGAGQSDAVERIMAAAGLRAMARRQDLGGIDRALVLEWNDTRS